MSHRIIIADSFEEAMKLLKDHVSKESPKQCAERGVQQEQLETLRDRLTPVKTFSFSDALERMKKGCRVARCGMPPGTYYATVYTPRFGDKSIDNHVAKFSAKSAVPWTPTHEDLLAEDWFLA